MVLVYHFVWIYVYFILNIYLFYNLKFNVFLFVLLLLNREIEILSMEVFQNVHVQWTVVFIRSLIFF